MSGLSFSLTTDLALSTKYSVATWRRASRASSSCSRYSKSSTYSMRVKRLGGLKCDPRPEAICKWDSAISPFYRGKVWLANVGCAPRAQSFLVPRLSLGTPCPAGSACPNERSEGRSHNRGRASHAARAQAEPGHEGRKANRFVH